MLEFWNIFAIYLEKSTKSKQIDLFYKSTRTLEPKYFYRKKSPKFSKSRKVFELGRFFERNHENIPKSKQTDIERNCKNIPSPRESFVNECNTEIKK